VLEVELVGADEDVVAFDFGDFVGDFAGGTGIFLGDDVAVGEFIEAVLVDFFDLGVVGGDDADVFAAVGN